VRNDFCAKTSGSEIVFNRVYSHKV
jgi:hypothetical protein